MDDATRLAKLIREAIESGTTGCLVWKDGLQSRFRRDRCLDGLTPEGLDELLVEFVRGGGRITCKPETREQWRGESDYVFEVLIPVPEFPRDLYVELILSDPVDEECPVAIIVSAHLSSFDRRVS